MKASNITKYYYRKKGFRKNQFAALNDVSLEIYQGHSVALIGESGSGKTTFGKVISMLEQPDGGTIEFCGKEIQDLGKREIRPMREDMQMIFQSSNDIFDPTYTVGDSIKEVLSNFCKLTEEEKDAKVVDILKKVELDPSLKDRYIRELSGGQCQRANIARALILEPKLIICDEPVSSLDYSIRKQILNLLNSIQQSSDVTYLLITHDLSNVPYLCKAVAIMFKGEIVEYIDGTENLEGRIVHPYTKELYQSIPSTDPGKRHIVCGDSCEGECCEIPTNEVCGYFDRCPCKLPICSEKKPAPKMLEDGHLVCCHLF